MQQASLNSSVRHGASPPQAMTAQWWTSPNLRLWTLVSPAILILATLAVFQVTKSVTSEWVTHLTGFAFYWSVSGIIIPMILLGRQGYASLFTRAPVTWSAGLRLGVMGLFIPAAFGFLFVFPYLFPGEKNLLIPGLVLYALLNGTFEEVFWRGLFIKQFRGNFWLGVVYPGVLFGIWQLVPWALFEWWLRPPPEIVLAVGIPFGLLFGWVAYRTGSIRLTVMAHVLANLAGVGALVIFAPG
jgi:membrane protease YdiL (CAAX protease family)